MFTESSFRESKVLQATADVQTEQEARMERIDSFLIFDSLILVVFGWFLYIPSSTAAMGVDGGLVALSGRCSEARPTGGLWTVSGWFLSEGQ